MHFWFVESEINQSAAAATTEIEKKIRIFIIHSLAENFDDKRVQIFRMIPIAFFTPPHFYDWIFYRWWRRIYAKWRRHHHHHHHREIYGALNKFMFNAFKIFKTFRFNKKFAFFIGIFSIQALHEMRFCTQNCIRDIFIFYFWHQLKINFMQNDN